MLTRVLEPEVMDSEEDAREYDSMDHAAVNAMFVADLMAVLPAAASIEILDLGAGTAQVPIAMCQQMPNVRVVAVDAAENMLAVARENVSAAGLADRIKLVLADAKRLPFPDASFQVVVSNSIVHHIAEPASVLAQAARIATPSAIQFHRDLCRPNDENELARLVTMYAGDATLYQQKLFSDSLRAALTLSEVQSLVAEQGFAANSVHMTSDRHWTWVAP
jgi:ubiquinone/menaquinone biosynthesis C-methylase UbiE